MAAANKNLHLTLEERKIILKGIESAASKTDIANTLGKDKSTIGKEIKKYRIKVYSCHLPLECANYKTCRHDRNCRHECIDFKQFRCNRRDRRPGACNGCLKIHTCRFDKFKYDPNQADFYYRKTLTESRQGINATREEIEQMAGILKPLLRKGQSPFHILEAHPEITVCEKTIYNYLEANVFGEFGLSNLDLRTQVKRKPSKKKKVCYKKRQDRKYLVGRSYKDYLDFCEDGTRTCQMDTVYNDISCGPFLQTFKFMDSSFLFALLHEELNSQNMLKGVGLLDGIVGPQLFQKHCEVLLSDRGPEFTKAEQMETGKGGMKRCHVFYCDPMRADQKGSLENNHKLLRYILPKGTDLRALGLRTQKDLNKVLSHVNSTPREKLGGKSPIELLEFLYPELYTKFYEFGIRKIPKDEVILKPFLLK